MVARPSSAAPQRSTASWTSKRPASATFVRHCLASNKHSETALLLDGASAQAPRDESFRNTAYRSNSTSAKGVPVPQFRALSSGFLTHKQRELMAAPRGPEEKPRRQPDRVRAWTSATPDPPPSVAEVARMRGRASEQLLDPRALRGRDQRGALFERVGGEKQRQRPRRQDVMERVLEAKRLRDAVQTRRLGQAGGHAEAETCQHQFRSRHNPPGQPQHGFPREHLLRSREEIVWGLQHKEILEQRKAWEAKDKVLFEKNRLRKMILDKLTQENNDKQQAKK